MYEPPPEATDSASVVTLVLASQPAEGPGADEPRWLWDWDGEPLLQHVLARVAAWPVASGVVVLGADAEEILERVDFSGFAVLIDPEWAEGEAASLRAGLDYIQRQPDVEAVVLTSADQAPAPATLVGSLLEQRLTSRRPATVPKYRYAVGRPMVIERQLWPRLMGLEAAVDVEAVLATHAQWVSEVWIDQIQPRSIGSLADLQEVAGRH
jgi:molybdenum cofactor cytidylyltransferase